MYLKFRTKKSLYQFKLEKIKLSNIWTVGTMNRTSDGFYVPYLDYDLFEKQDLDGELLRLQEGFNLGNLHVFQSSEKRFHILGFTKLTAYQFTQMLLNSSCDEAFKNVPRFFSYRNWVLRAFSKGEKEKPKYLYSLFRKTGKDESFAHYVTLSSIYPQIKNTLQNSDGLTKVSVISYGTAERKT